MAITTNDNLFRKKHSMAKMSDGDEVFGEITEMNYSELNDYIDSRYIPKITNASFTFMISATGFDYDMNQDSKEVKRQILDYYKDTADYTESALDEETIYRLNDWQLVRKEIDPDTDEEFDTYDLEELDAGNTYNSSYLGAMDVNWRLFYDADYEKYFYVIHPHLGGDPRGNYGNAFILEGDDKDDLLYRFYEGFISGSATIYLEFNDGSNLHFYSEQDSDVYLFRNEVDEDSISANSTAQKYLNDFNKFDGYKADEFLTETINIYEKQKDSKKKYGGSVNDESPRVYVQILGYPEGAWIELRDFKNGQEVIGYIENWMDKFNESKGGNREEYAFHDYEGFGKHLYSEYMGESEFDEILEAYEQYENSDYPTSVIEEYISNTGIENTMDAIREMNDKYYGAYDDVSDFIQQMVDEGVYVPTQNEMYVSDIDKRLIAGEEADNRVQDMDLEEILSLVDKTDEYESEKSELQDKIDSLESLLNNADDDLTAETTDELVDLNDELNKLDEKYLDMYRDEANSLIYDDVYERLDKNLEEFLDEYGYSSNDLQNVPFLQIDYDQIERNLMGDYLIIEDEGKYYIFISYKKGGVISKRKNVFAKPFYVVELTSKKIVDAFDSKADARKHKNEISPKYKKLRFEVYSYDMLEPKMGIKSFKETSNWINFNDYSHVSKVKINKPKVAIKEQGGQMQEQAPAPALAPAPAPAPAVQPTMDETYGDLKDYLEKDTLKGKTKRGFKAVGRGITTGAKWVHKKWLDADFGDGKGEAKFFADGGKVPNRESMFELPLEMVVYVPSTQDVDKVISVDEMDARVDEVKNYLATKFGGYTSSDKIGGFVDSKGKLVNEDIVQVVSFAEKEAFEKNKKALINQLADWGKKWGQEAIGFEFEGDLLYVPQKFKKGGELWIQDAVDKMKSKGTLGAFTKQAKREGMKPVEFAKKVIANPNDYQTKTLRRAYFVKNTNPEKF